MNYKELSKVADSVEVKYNFTPKTNKELRDLVGRLIEERGVNADLNDIDVSNVTDMNSMFYQSDFNGDISKWDVSSVTDMSYMFGSSKFNGDISKWDVSHVTNMHFMFGYSKFNGDISKWDVSNVTDMERMFYGAKFNGDISNWNVASTTNISSMFAHSKFNGDISNWNPSTKKASTKKASTKKASTKKAKSLVLNTYDEFAAWLESLYNEEGGEFSANVAGHTVTIFISPQSEPDEDGEYPYRAYWTTVNVDGDEVWQQYESDIPSIPDVDFFDIEFETSNDSHADIFAKISERVKSTIPEAKVTKTAKGFKVQAPWKSEEYDLKEFEDRGIVEFYDQIDKGDDHVDVWHWA